MFKPVAAFAGISTTSLDEAKKFYSDKLGLELDNETMGLTYKLPGGGKLYIYEKSDHAPATFTVLNFVVTDIDAAAKQLEEGGIKFLRYDGMPQDDHGIARGKAAGMGPDIAWFEDPAGNILSVLQD